MPRWLSIAHGTTLIILFVGCIGSPIWAYLSTNVIPISSYNLTNTEGEVIVESFKFQLSSENYGVWIARKLKIHPPKWPQRPRLSESELTSYPGMRVCILTLRMGKRCYDALNASRRRILHLIPCDHYIFCHWPRCTRCIITDWF